MKYIYNILILLSAIFFVACDNMEQNCANWGNTVFYSDFLWEHYDPVKMEQTLVLNFNDDARRHFNGIAVLELVVQKDEELQSTMEYMTLYKNDSICKQNRLILNANDSEVKVGVEFLANAPAGNYKLFLVPIDKGGLDSIEQIELENGFYIQKIDKINPLAKKTIWITIVVVGLFIAWLIFSRAINPNLKFSRISFDYNDGNGEIYHRVRGCYKIICTNKPKRVSLVHKIFVGNVYVEVNDFWSSEVTIKCGPRKSIRLITRGDYLLPDEPLRKEPFMIQGESQRKVNIETT